VSTVWEELSERIRGEAEELDRIVRRTEGVWRKACRNIGERDIYLDSVALSLHGFYSGIEKLFELISYRIDNNFPTGRTWHRDLILKMTEEVQGVRPAVINNCWLPQLDEFRRFDIWFEMCIPTISFRTKWHPLYLYCRSYGFT
jgi:hypothetical protein